MLRPEAMSGFGVSLFGVRAAVVTDSAAAAEVLDRYVLPWLPREPPREATADRLVEVRARGAGFEVVVDGAVKEEAATELAAIPHVQRALDDIVVRLQREFAVLHCGAVAHHGRAVLLPGPTRSGKSTLVAELVRRGMPYLSDEYALIDAGGRVHPYPRALLLRDRGDVERPRLAAELGGVVAEGPMPAGLILGLRYAPGAATAFEALSQGEGLLLLLRNTPQVLVDQPWILSPLERAVADATCSAGLRGDVEEAAAAILGLASSAAVPGEPRASAGARGPGQCSPGSGRSAAASRAQ